jgi:hypothetical protein
MAIISLFLANCCSEDFSTMMNRSGGSIIVSFVIPEVKLSLFTNEYHINWGDCHIWPLLAWDNFLYSKLIRGFFFHKMLLYFIRCFFECVEMIIYLFILVGLRFELRALCLGNRCYTAWAHLQSILLWLRWR